MDDPDVDLELIALLRESLGFSNKGQEGVSSDTGVLKDAEHIAHNAVDVSLSMYGTRDAAAALYKVMRERQYSTQTWSEHELHPKLGVDVDEVGLVNFVFTMDLLNFSFWSEKSAEERFQVEYRGKLWTGYNSLVACLRRALDEGVPITTPSFWRTAEDLTATMGKAFRSVTDEIVPLFDERVAVLREAADVLHKIYGDSDDYGDDDDEDDNEQYHDYDMMDFDRPQDSRPVASSALPVDKPTGLEGSASTSDTQLEGILTPASTDTNGVPQDESTEMSETTANDTNHAAEPLSEEPVMKPAEVVRSDMSVVRLIQEANGSAGKLVNLLAKYFPCFQDQGRFDGRKVRFLKRAQIFVADLWAAFNGTAYGAFYDIGHLTMFADYRVPQMLYNLGVLAFAPPLEGRIRRTEELVHGDSWEVQLRGCSIWAVEMIRRQIVHDHPETEAEVEVNAVLLDFLLYDLAKEIETTGTETIPHHRTRSIWY